MSNYTDKELEEYRGKYLWPPAELHPEYGAVRAEVWEAIRSALLRGWSPTVIGYTLNGRLHLLDDLSGRNKRRPYQLLTLKKIRAKLCKIEGPPPLTTNAKKYLEILS